MDNARPDRRRWRITRLFNQIDPAGLKAALIACPPHREKCILEVINPATANDVGCTLLIHPVLKKRCYHDCGTVHVWYFGESWWVSAVVAVCCLSAQRPSVMTKVYIRIRPPRQGHETRSAHPSLQKMSSDIRHVVPSLMCRCSLASSFDVFQPRSHPLLPTGWPCRQKLNCLHDVQATR
jgi:hypothetical protein